MSQDGRFLRASESSHRARACRRDRWRDAFRRAFRRPSRRRRDIQVMVNVRDADLEGVDVLICRLDARQRRVHRAACFASFDGCAPARRVRRRNTCASRTDRPASRLLPLRIHDHEIDIRAVIARRVGKDAHRCFVERTRPLICSDIPPDVVHSQMAHPIRRPARTALSSSSIVGPKRSRKIPETVITTSMRGRSQMSRVGWLRPA